MTNSREKLPKTPEGWIKKSIELDLIYDEEKKIPREPEEIKPFCDLGVNFQGWYRYFYKLKESRVFYGLDLDKKGLEFASGESEDYKKLKKAKKKDIDKLDDITWRCAAAINTLRPMREDDKAATLIALFHSELCASSTKDVSWGQAKSFTATVTNKAVGYEIFRWIASHNVARSESHLGLSMEAIRTTVPLVDNFYDNVDNFAEEIKCKKDILFQALFFQASRTLSQALTDMKRYTESRYYLKAAFAEAEKQKSNYWKFFFKLLIFVERLDTKRINSDPKKVFKGLKGIKFRPRMVIEKRGAISRYPIELDDDSEWKKFWRTGKIFDSDWKESEEWLLRWHSAEPQQLGIHLATIAKKIISVFQNRSDDLQNNELICIIVSVFYIAHTTLKRFSNQKKNGYVYWLLGYNQKGLKNVSQRNKNYIWVQGNVLYSALRVINKQLDNLKMKNKENVWIFNWEKRLKNFIESNEFNQVRSEAAKAEALQESPKPKTKFSGWCPRCKSRQCDRLCPVNRFLNNEPNSKDYVFASRDYYYDIMSARQKRFLSYIQNRTGRDRYYQQGETHRPSPCFEIICLRRWNSFSPNLGSHAAATVGGGYFVRAWDGKNGRYIGIVIDPGYNFLENLFNEGFTIADVDLVVITHAHPDHIENFTNLLTLLRERDKRLKEEDGSDSLTSPREHRILLAVTEGVFERLKRNLDAEKEFIQDIVVLTATHDAKEGNSRGSEAGKMQLELWLDDDYVCHMDLRGSGLADKVKVSLRATRAWHDDYTSYDTIGMVIEYQNCENDCKDDKCNKIVKQDESAKSKKIGIIGDSRYTLELYEDYKKCDVLVTHLGSLVDEDDYRDHPNKQNDIVSLDNKKLLELLAEKNHLYLPGLALLICDLQKKSKNGFPLMILSEFGEELRGGLRKDIAKRLSYFWKRGSQNPLPIIPGDVGLRIDVDLKKVFCCICHRYEEPKNIIPEIVLPDEESMAYVCKDCKELRGGELNTLLEEWCRTARPVVRLKPKESNDLHKDTD